MYSARPTSWFPLLTELVVRDLFVKDAAILHKIRSKKEILKGCIIKMPILLNMRLRLRLCFHCAVSCFIVFFLNVM